MSDLGSSIGHLGQSTQSTMTDWAGQAANTVMGSVPLMVACGVILALFVLWFLRHAF